MADEVTEPEPWRSDLTIVHLHRLPAEGVRPSYWQIDIWEPGLELFSRWERTRPLADLTARIALAGAGIRPFYPSEAA